MSPTSPRRSQETVSIKQQVIAKLEEAFGRIAVALDVPVDVVRNIACRRRPPLTQGEIKNRERAIQKLRAQGYPNATIADALSLSLMETNRIISRLLDEGKLAPRPRGNVLSPQKLLERKKKIIELREKGCPRTEIADLLGLGINTVKECITDLVAEGKIKEVPTMRQEGMLERKKNIAALCEQGCSNGEIAQKLGLPYYIVGNMVHKLIEEGVIAPHSRRREK